MAYSKYSSDRAPGREHIPLYPKGFIAIRIIQLIIAILIAGLSAFGVHIFAFDGDVLILAVAVMTLISSTYHLITRFSTPKAYNYWAVLAVDILVLVLWLASFALLASEIIWFFTLWTSSSESVPTVDPYYDDFTPDEDSYDFYTYGVLAALKRGAVGNKARASGRYGDSGGLDDIYDDGGGYDESAVVKTLVAPICVIAAAALGGIEFILHLISLIIHSVFLHRHRAAGLHSKPVQSSPSSNSGSGSGSDSSNTILVSPNAVPAPAAIFTTTPNEKLPYYHQELDSTPISVPSNHNHNQQPSAPAPAYTPVSSQQQQQQHLQQPHHQRQYQAYQQPQGQAQGQPSVYYHSPVSPQTTGGTLNYTQFQQPWTVSPVPTTPPVSTHYGPIGVRAGIYQLP